MGSIPRTILPLLALALLPPTGVPAQEGSRLVLLMAGDTISQEQFTRTANLLQAEMLSPALGVRFRYSVTLGTDGVPSRMDNAFWQPADADTAPPRQRAAIHFRGDSVIVEVAGGRTQRLASEAGALPFINPSFALIELFLRRAAILGQDTVRIPAFAIQGGQTFAMSIQRQGADSVIVDIGGVAARLRVDAQGRILGGSVPAQGLRITRAPATGRPLSATPPDYSAPAGAPYRAIEVEIPTPAGHTLAGTLTLPAEASATNRVGAVVTSTGSGLQDRDEALPTVSGYRPFRQLADTLSRHGMAVLRMDDRSFGGSGGNASNATSRDFAEDIQAGLAWLRHRPEIDPSRLAIVGHSEGGLIAPLVAAGDTNLAGIVLLAGPSRSGREILAFQQRAAIERAPDLSQAQRDSLIEVSRMATDSMARTSPWLREFLDYDPLATARQVRRTPVLIVQGATDLQVTADQAPELEAAFKAGGNPDVTMRIYPEANHLLIQDPDGNPAAYASLPSRVVRPDILADILHWLRARLELPPVEGTPPAPEG